MGNLEKSIKSFNLAFTDTLESADLTRVDFDPANIVINYDKCISLYDLIVSFNKMHSAFKKELDDLPKLDLGKEVRAMKFAKHESDMRYLELRVYGPYMVNRNYIFLCLREILGKPLPYITNGQTIHSDDYFQETIKIPPKVVKGYLDLFDKYQLLFELYQHLRNKKIFDDFTYSLQTGIDSQDDNFFDQMTSFIVKLDNDSTDHIQIFVNLGDEELDVDLDESYINLDGKIVKPDKDGYLDILKKTYVNGSHLGKNGNPIEKGFVR